MNRALGRISSLATALALALAVSTMGTATADDLTVARVESAEQYALRLLNCTRTGGWVTASGTCLGRASGKYSTYRKPLRLHGGISTKVAWPWARAMVVNNVCGHSIAGKPDLVQRMRRQGFGYYSYGENVGCASSASDAKALVLAIHRMMQAEKASGGGHWRNMKNRSFKSVGIGVATRDGRTMMVWDFYGRRY